jgi:nicotinamidase-related amidase
LVKPEEVEFEPGDALLVIDVLDDFDHEDGMSLLESFRERGPTMAAAIAAAREVGIPVIYVNDDRDRWDGDAPALARDAAEGPGAGIIRELLPQAGDRVLLKHRYSAFDHTALELLLEAESVQRVLVVGATTEGCVAQTALDAREHGLKATILRDSCATVDADREELALRYAAEVGGIRVRSLGSVGGAGGSREGFSVGSGGTSGETRSVLEEEE